MEKHTVDTKFDETGNVETKIVEVVDFADESFCEFHVVTCDESTGEYVETTQVFTDFDEAMKVWEAA